MSRNLKVSLDQQQHFLPLTRFNSIPSAREQASTTAFIGRLQMHKDRIFLLRKNKPPPGKYGGGFALNMPGYFHLNGCD